MKKTREGFKLELESYRELKQDWDGYDADPIFPGAIDLAIKFVDILDEKLIADAVLFPRSDGEIGFMWSFGSFNDYFELNVTNEGIVRGFKENDIEYINFEDCSIEQAAVLAKKTVLGS